MRKGIGIALLSLGLGGCAALHPGLSGSRDAGAAKSALANATHVMQLPASQQRAACASARKQLGSTPPPSASDGLSLVALGLAVPACLAPADIQRLLRRLPKSALVEYLRLLAARQANDEQALLQAQDKITSLQTKIKALTLIEQQLNQVNNLELRHPGQSKTSPR
ncbi:hypothetical protein BW247_10015 [Acidihalobacter ferrooxydans]|uniref:Lipoprotein n=2 Tax=Acidihalobacter ferrooxydans TaxID=1765967 RepID=A0A1P8UHT8_9GAMM|nr:hypothetical protein BW247_10015 [Acidihalobacter ferrooxydans]